MKIRITNYTFDASAKTITFNDYASIELEGVLIITNVTDNVIIYNFADPTKGGTVSGNVLTLDYDTTAMSDTDKLLIYYDEPTQTTPINVLATSGSSVIGKVSIDQTTPGITNKVSLGSDVVHTIIDSGTVAVTGTVPVSSTQLPVALGAGGGLKVDGSGTPLPVTGTITAVTSITNALPAGTNNIGKVDVATLPALPAGTNNIGDVDVATLPSLPAGSNLIGNVGHGKTIKTVTGTTSSTATIVSAVSGKRIKVIAYSLMMTGATAVTCTFKSGAGGTALWTVGPLQAPASVTAGANLSIPAPSFLFGTAAGSLLELALSAAVSVTYAISYFDDDDT